VRRLFNLGLNLGLVLLSLWLHDKARVWAARRCGDSEAAARQRSPENPLARVDWIGSVLLPAFLIFRSQPVLGWTRLLDLNEDRLRSPRRCGLGIALAGPLANLLLAALGVVLFRSLAASGWLTSPYLLKALPFFCLANANLAVFNLLPIPPLAATMAVEPLLGGDALSSFEDIRPFGFLLLLAGVYFNFFDFLTVPIGRLVNSLLGF